MIVVLQGKSPKRRRLYMITVGSEERCDHNGYPIVVTPTETGYYYASYLACRTRGPKRSNSRAAHRALKEGVERLYQPGLRPSLLPIAPMWGRVVPID